MIETSRAWIRLWIGLAVSPALIAAQAVPSVSDSRAVIATPVDDAPSPAVAPLAPGYVRLPANTPVEVQIDDPLSSKTSHIDDLFAIRLRDPILLDGRIIIPAGTRGQGQVVHAAKARALGKAGELILAARYLECGDLHIALRGFRLNKAGQDKSGVIVASMAVAGIVAAPLAFVSGGESIVPVGAPGTARLMSAVDVRMAPVPVCATPPADEADPVPPVPPQEGAAARAPAPPPAPVS